MNRVLESLSDLSVADGSVGGGAGPVFATLVAIDADGRLLARDPAGAECWCDWLEGPEPAPPLAVGDILLALAVPASGVTVVLGRVGRYRPAPPALVLKATESLRLECGAAQLELRADGRLLLRGEDILMRATGTQRIRAGTVSIN